jgi:hypothetical protein
MVKSRDLRDVAVFHYKNGKKAPEIAKLLANKVHRSTIDRWLTRYRQSGSFEAKPKSGRPKAGRTKRLINLVQKRLDSDNRGKTLRTMAKDFNSSVQTIKRVFNLDLHKKCYRKISVQKLKDEQKPIRKTCCQWLRKNVNYGKLKRLMFTDEKIFTRNGYFNPKNDVVWADDRSDANERGGLHSTEKYPVSIMVGLGVTWNGPTRPFFFKKTNASMDKLTMTNCYHFIKRKVMNYLGTKIGVYSRMERARIRMQKFSNGVEITSNSLFRRRDGRPTHLN